MTPSAALLVALFSQGPSASGMAPSTAVVKLRLDVRAASECTSRGDLAERIAARSRRIEIADDAPLSAQVTVSAARSRNLVADLVLTSPGMGPTERRVVARSCAEVADGAALIIAVTLDPTLQRNRTAGPGDEKAPTGDGREASAAAAGASQPAAPPVGKESSVPPAAPPVPSTETPPAPTAPPVPPLTVQAEVKPPAAPDAAGKRELGATLAGQTIFGAAPSVMPGVALFGMAALDRQGLWAPALFVGATHAWRSDFSETGGSASFTLDAATVDVCPLRLRWSYLVARPCADALVGRLAAQGSDTRQPGSSARPFGAAGAALSASFGSRVQLSARVGVGVTLLRDSYELATVFYKAAPLTISASLGVGWGWH
jgi:hypothetical protein